MTEEKNRTQEKKITYEMFEVFYKTNPDLDNKEYYEQFPTINQGTVRNWKSKAKKPVASTTPPIVPTGTDEEIKIEVEALKLKLKDKIPQYILDMDVDPHTHKKLIQNALIAQTTATPNQTAPNTPILGIPIGGARKRGIDKYLTIDPERHEINLSIPASVVFDPEKNKKLGEYN